MIWRLLIIISGFNGLIGCSHLGYYAHVMNGHLSIIQQTEPITKILAESEDSQLKQQLETILNIKAFATDILHLPKNASYTDYVDLKRSYVLWNVFATLPFSLELKQWCFLFVGCVSYRSYFTEDLAQSLAEELRQQGYDVYVAEIVAYSTLGWSNDPVLNTMLAWPTPQLAGIIFHELAHQQLYVKDDSTFNESFASTVEQIGTERWLAHYGTTQEIADYQQSTRREQEFIDLIMTTRGELEKIYQQSLPTEQMTLAKQRAFDQLQQRYIQLKRQWEGYSGYDKWFSTLNNAKLASVTTYQHYVPAFQALLARCHHDLTKFYIAAQQLGQQPFDERQQQLKQLVYEKNTLNGQQNCGF